jgi:hypothetical protein
MFRHIEPSSGQIQNMVLVHSVSAHIMGSHTVLPILVVARSQVWVCDRLLFGTAGSNPADM